MWLDGTAPSLHAYDPAENFGGGHGQIGMLQAIAVGGDLIPRAARYAVDYQAAVALIDHHVAGPDLRRALHVEQIAGPESGQHAAAGDRQARLAAGSEDFGGQVEFEGFYQLVFITRL